jgi:hypothetical protein
MEALSLSVRSACIACACGVHPACTAERTAADALVAAREPTA